MGRSPYCAIVLTGDRISREHARFVLRGASLTVEDLGSANGTLVNGSKIETATKLDDGDVVRIGAEELSVTKTPADPRRGSSTVEDSG